MHNKPGVSCPDCDAQFTRRDFVKTVGVAALAAGATPLMAPLPRAFAASTPKSAPETAVKRLYDSLSEAQRKEICLPFGHETRSRINANWAITKPAIVDDFYTADQRQLIGEIFRGITSEDGYERILKQTEFDNGGWDRYHIAIFGEPGGEKFQWEMTGRHLTMRADGNTLAGAAFGGPVVYGHGEEDPADNLFHYQTQKANEVFKALDAKQAERALLENAPPEAQVQLQGKTGKFPGIAISDLSADQKRLVESVIKVLLAPYRQEDIDESMVLLKEGGGLDALHMAFYKQGDHNNDRVWDIWRVEGPTFVSHFRGHPHVHAYLNVGLKQA
jgi:hypothetical protein